MTTLKNNIKNIIKILVFIAIFVLLYNRVEFILEERTSSDKYRRFFQEKQDFQVLFMGNSHVTNGIYPMDLYKDQGFASYNFGGHANTIPTTYWITKNALDYKTPELIVLDLRLIGSEKRHSDEVRYLHVSLDCFPMSRTKLNSINDLLTKEEKPEFLWKMWIYHNRWNELDEKDFTGEKKTEMGAEYRVNISKKAVKNEDYDRDLFLPESTLGTEYLEKLTKECKEKGIQLLFIYMPISIEDEDVPEINSAPLIASGLGINYIDFNELDIVDYSTDFYDNNGHLNPSGARKVTEYLGNYITENYDITKVRGEQSYSDWEVALQDYDRMKLAALNDEEDLDNFLMLLHDKDYEAEVILYDEDLLKSDRTVRLLKNAGVYDSIHPADEEELRSARDYSGEDVKIGIKVKDSATKTVVCERVF